TRTEKTIVTLEGEVIDPHGVVTGGSRESALAGVLEQKREIRELEEEGARIEAGVQAALSPPLGRKPALADARPEHAHPGPPPRASSTSWPRPRAATRSRWSASRRTSIAPGGSSGAWPGGGGRSSRRSTTCAAPPRRPGAGSKPRALRWRATSRSPRRPSGG